MEEYSQFVTFIGQGSYLRDAIKSAHKQLDTAWEISEFAATGRRIICATTATNTKDGYNPWVFTITCEFQGPK